MKFLSTNKFIIAALALCISASLFVFIISVKQTKKVENTSIEVVHTNKVLGSLDNIITTTLDIQVSVRGFVISGDEEMLESYKQAAARYKAALEIIRQQEGRKHIYTKQLDSLGFYISNRLAWANKTIALRRQQKNQEAASIIASGEGSYYSGKIRAVCDEIKVAELQNQNDIRTANEKAIKSLNTTLYMALIAVVILGVLLFTKVKTSYNEHRNGEAKFRALMDSAPDAMLISDQRGNIQLANKRAVEMLGFTNEEFEGMPVEALVPVAMREKHQFLRTDYAIAPKIREMHSGLEMQAVNKNGKVIPVDISLSPIYTNGETLFAAALRDISQKKLAQEEIRTLFTQINQASEAIYVVDNKLVIKSWNKGAENLYNYTAKEAIGQNSLQMLKTELTNEEMNEALSKIEQTGFWSGEIKRYTKEGNEIYVYSSLSEVRGSDGQTKNYVSVSFDISQRKKLEAQVKHLASIVENSSEAILSRDMDRRIITWNNGAEKMFGYSKEEAIGKSVTELGVMRINDSNKLQIEKAIKNSGVWHEEIEYYHKNGNTIYGEVTGNAVRDSKGNITGLSFVIRDITARKQLEKHQRQYNEELEKKIKERTKEITLNEQKYRLLYNNNPMPMFVLDLETFKFLDLNDSAEKLYGYSRNEFQQMTALDIRPEEDKADFINMDHSFEPAAAGNNKGIWRHIKKDGTLITVEIFGHSILFEGRQARLILVNDVTEKLKAERRLKKSENRFRALIEKSYDIIILLDKDFRITYRSPSTFRSTGRSDEETIGTDVRGHIHPDDLFIIERCANRLLNIENTVEDCLFRYQHKNGYYLWFEGKATNLLQDENVKAIVFNYRDVTERVKAQARIKASEKRFRALIENSYDIITMLDKDFRVIYRSPSAKRVTGRESDDVIGLDGRTRIHPDDMNMVAAGIKRLLEKPGHAEECTFRYLHKDGHWLWFEGNATNLLHDENVRSIVFNYRDVTERLKAQKNLQLSERRFRSLIENGSDIINLLDDSFRVIYRSPSAVKGSLSNEEVMGKDGRSRVHPNDWPAMSKGINRLLSKPGNIEKTLFRYRTKDDNYIWLEGTATNLLQDDAVNAIVFNYREVTERMEAENKLKISEERYRSTLDNMIEGVQIIGLDWKYKYVNDAVEKQAKCTKDKLIGYTMMERYPGIENTDFFRAMQNCLATGKPVLLENKFVYPDKSVAWFELSIQPVQEGVFILSVDITERVKAGEELREEKDKLTSIAATSPGLIYSFRMTKEGSFSFPFVSSSVEDIFGFTAEQLKEDVSSLLESALPDDIDMVVSGIRQSAENMAQWQQEFRYNHPAKGIRWLEGNSIPTREKDGNILWHGIIMDITERKKAEEKITEKNAQLETLSNNLPGVMIYQLSGENFNDRRFTYVSKEVTRLTGKTPEQVIADPSLLYGLIVEEDIARLLEAEKKSYQDFSVFNEEVRCRLNNGEIRWLNIISTPRRTNEGKIVWDGFHVDITERKKNDAAIRSSYTEKRILAEKLTTILNTLPANIALLDENGIIVDVNHTWVESAAQYNWYGNNYGIGANYISLTESSAFFEFEGIERKQLAEGINAVLNKTADKFVYECHTTDQKHWFRKIISPISGDDSRGAVVMHIDITQVHQLEEEKIRSKNEEQKMVTAAILQGQEKERNAIGKELHDNINQILAGINMLMGIVVKRPERINELLPLCIDHINLAINENRKMAHELVAPGANAENLIEQVKNVAKNMLQKAGIAVKVNYKNFDESLLSNEQKLAAYRIVQEQCNNIHKYAEAKKVVFLLDTSATSFLLIIKDNGKGMDKNKHTDGIGIQNIKNRAGVFNGHVNITTKPGAGFMLSVEIPLMPLN